MKARARSTMPPDVACNLVEVTDTAIGFNLLFRSVCGAGRSRVTELADAYRLLLPPLRVGVAGTLFCVALVLGAKLVGHRDTGRSDRHGRISESQSPVGAARAGETISGYGACGRRHCVVGSAGANRLLVSSEVFLGPQLPFALIPLLYFTTSRKHLGCRW